MKPLPLIVVLTVLAGMVLALILVGIVAVLA